MLTLLQVFAFYIVNACTGCNKQHHWGFWLKYIVFWGGLTDFYNLSQNLGHIQNRPSTGLRNHWLTHWLQKSQVPPHRLQENTNMWSGFVPEGRRKFPKLLSECWKDTYASNATVLWDFSVPGKSALIWTIRKHAWVIKSVASNYRIYQLTASFLL